MQAQVKSSLNRERGIGDKILSHGAIENCDFRGEGKIFSKNFQVKSITFSEYIIALVGGKLGKIILFCFKREIIISHRPKLLRWTISDFITQCSYFLDVLEKSKKKSQTYADFHLWIFGMISIHERQHLAYSNSWRMYVNSFSLVQHFHLQTTATVVPAFFYYFSSQTPVSAYKPGYLGILPP